MSEWWSGEPASTLGVDGHAQHLTAAAVPASGSHPATMRPGPDAGGLGVAVGSRLVSVAAANQGDNPSNEALISALIQARDKDAGPAWDQLFQAVIASYFLVEGRSPSELRFDIALPQTYVLGFSSHEALHRCRPRVGEDHVWYPAPPLFEHALEKGKDGLLLDHESDTEFRFTRWHSAWLAAGLTCLFRPIDDETSLTRTIELLRPVLGRHPIESAHLVWAFDGDGIWQLVLAVAPVGRWPELWRDGFATELRSLSQRHFEDRLLRLVALAEPPSSGHPFFEVVPARRH